ncbi:Hypothetical protein A7982_09257 [Minicystis rosea]|nr:Hypothetical protein A7982_09257 [Minicystis rosea]
MRIASSLLFFLALLAGCGSSIVTGGTGGAGGNTNTGGSTGTGDDPVGESPCPPAEPSGLACLGVPSGFRCTYGDSVRPDCRREWFCTDGKWVTAKNLCLEPPAGACVPAEPAQSTLCEDEGAACTYGNDFCVCSSCTGGPCMQNAVWTCFKPPSGCPAIVPNDGTVCQTPGATCTYGSPCSAFGAKAVCENGLWKWDSEQVCPL